MSVTSVHGPAHSPVHSPRYTPTRFSVPFTNFPFANMTGYRLEKLAYMPSSLCRFLKTPPSRRVILFVWRNLHIEMCKLLEVVGTAVPNTTGIQGEVQAKMLCRQTDITRARKLQAKCALYCQ